MAMKAKDLIHVRGSTAPVGVENRAVDKFVDVVRGFVDAEEVGKAFAVNGYGVDNHVRLLMDIVKANKDNDDPASCKLVMQALKNLQDLQKEVVKSKEMLAKLSIMDRSLKAVEAKKIMIPSRSREDGKHQSGTTEQFGKGKDGNFAGSVHFEPEIPGDKKELHGGIRPQSPT